MQRFLFIVLIQTVSISVFAKQGHSLKLNELLQMSYKGNNELESYKSMARAEDSLVTSKYTPTDPIIGLSNFRHNNTTQYGTISQKIKFPVKYFLEGKAQSRLAASKKANYDNKKWEIRHKVISTYFSIYASQKIIQLTQINSQALKEFSRVAEKKYASGKSSQADTMKAHFELTQLELDLIQLKQAENGLQERMRALVGNNSLLRLELANLKLKSPLFKKEKIPEPIRKLTNTLKKNSPNLKSEMHLLERATQKSNLAKWQFAPDIQFTYQQRISGLPEDARTYSIGLSFPLWFWKKGSEASAANSQKIVQDAKLRNTINHLVAKVRDLTGKVVATKKTLEIYQSSLIPQAEGTFNSSRAAYRASKTSFLNLLDSERSLYRVKAGFYRSLKQYASYLSELEQKLGFSISNFEGEIK